jgi:hypothetical protein
MRRLVVPILAAIALAGCAGAYVAGDVGADHGDLSRDHVASHPVSLGGGAQRLALTGSASSQR